MTSIETILVPLAPGFEEIEFVTIVDVLRRADLDVTVAGLVRGTVTGAHDIAVTPDAYLGDIDLARFTMIVLPGGQPGTRNLAKDERVLGVVRRLANEKKIVAAICAAPKVLHVAGILEGVEVTAHSSVRNDLSGAIVKTEPRTVVSGPPTSGTPTSGEASSGAATAGTTTAGSVTSGPATSGPATSGPATSSTATAGTRTSGIVVTSQGAGTAMEFSLTLVAVLRGDAKAAELGRAMVVPRG